MAGEARISRGHEGDSQMKWKPMGWIILTGCVAAVALAVYCS
jgi:hypothetical protein